MSIIFLWSTSLLAIPYFGLWRRNHDRLAAAVLVFSMLSIQLLCHLEAASRHTFSPWLFDMANLLSP